MTCETTIVIVGMYKDNVLHLFVAELEWPLATLTFTLSTSIMSRDDTIELASLSKVGMVHYSFAVSDCVCCFRFFSYYESGCHDVIMLMEWSIVGVFHSHPLTCFMREPSQAFDRARLRAGGGKLPMMTSGVLPCDSIISSCEEVGEMARDISS